MRFEFVRGTMCENSKFDSYYTHTIHICKLYSLPGRAIESGRSRCSFVPALRRLGNTRLVLSFPKHVVVDVYGLFLVQV